MLVAPMSFWDDLQKAFVKADQARRKRLLELLERLIDGPQNKEESQATRAA